jgi:hypothetical protein
LPPKRRPKDGRWRVAVALLALVMPITGRTFGGQAMKSTSVATVVRRHVRLHAAQRVLEAYSAGEAFLPLVRDMPTDQRRAVEGLLRAAAEAWGLAVAAAERPSREDDTWLR